MCSLNNKDIYDFYKSFGMEKCLSFVKSKFSSLESHEIEPTDKSFEYCIKKVWDRVAKLNKSKGRKPVADELEAFLKSNFIFPKADLSKRGQQVLTDESLDFKQSLLQKKLENKSLTEKIVETESIIKNKEEELNTANEKLTLSSKKVESLKLNLKRTASRETYANKKIRKLEENINEHCCTDKEERIHQLESILKEKEKEINELTESVNYLNDLINDNGVGVNVFDEFSKRYTPQLKQCVYDLLILNVSASKVGDVIKSVLRLVNKEPNKVPCKTTVLNMNLQRLCLAHKQIAEVFSKEMNTCLLTDETSKFGSKYMGYEASDSSGNLWVLGLRDIETKSAENTLKVFREIMLDLSYVSPSQSTPNEIICHISSTMSDRAATEVKFNELLEVYRKEVLPLTYANYHSFTEEEKLKLGKLNNFFCGLHALVNYAEASQKSIKELENRIFDENVPLYDKTYTTDEPGVCRLVRTASKCFGEGSGGDEKSGCQRQFATYISDFLKENNLKSVPLRAYKGSRFNVLFSNACSVFFLHDKMVSFLENVGCCNKLQKSVLFDLKIREFIAGIKALALISKFVTSPLWCVLEDKKVSLMEMNIKYLELVTFLEDASANIGNFMSGGMTVFPEYVQKDCMLEYLLEPQEYDIIVESFLQVILGTICQLAKKLYKEHLPGGKLTNIDPETIKGNPKTSCFAESVFGQLDQMIRMKPNISTLAAESCIMFLNNGTMEWLKSKEERVKNQLILDASKQIKRCRLNYKNRLKEIDDRRKEKIREKVRLKEQQEREKLKKQTEYTNDIITHGLWQSESEIENMLQSYSSKAEQLQALKAQIKFRKEVLHQITDDKKTFNFTKSREGKKSRQSLNVEELKLNLKILVRQAVVRDEEAQQEKHILVGKRVQHRFTVEENGSKIDKWYTGKIISQVPSFREWFNIVYDGDEAVYTYHQLDTELESNDLKILI